MDELIEVLRRVPVFREVDDAGLEQIAERCSRISHPAGHVLFREGDPGSSLFVVLSGLVRVSRSTGPGAPQLVAERGIGECVGEMALLDGLPRTADVTVVEPCDLLMLSRADFTALMSRTPRMMVAVLQVVAQRLRQAEEQHRRQGAPDVADRLSHILARTIAPEAGKPPKTP